jgi:hypothetical protein
MFCYSGNLYYYLIFCKIFFAWLLKGQAMSQPAFQQFMNYSAGHGSDPSANADSAATRIAADPDTHHDFEPKSKSSDMSLHDVVAQVFA